MRLSEAQQAVIDIDDGVRFEPEDRKSIEKVARYIIRPPLSLERLRYPDGDDQVVYQKPPRGGFREQRMGCR